MLDLQEDTENEIEFGDLTLHLNWDLEWSCVEDERGHDTWECSANLTGGYLYTEVRGPTVALTAHQIKTLLGADRIKAAKLRAEENTYEDMR